MCLYHDHCVNSFQIRSYFWSVFSCIWTKYGDLLRKSPYSVQIQENKDQKKLRIWPLFAQYLMQKLYCQLSSTPLMGTVAEPFKSNVYLPGET